VAFPQDGQRFIRANASLSLIAGVTPVTQRIFRDTVDRLGIRVDQRSGVAGLQVLLIGVYQQGCSLLCAGKGARGGAVTPYRRPKPLWPEDSIV
jgi:hypothetical protein